MLTRLDKIRNRPLTDDGALREPPSPIDEDAARIKIVRLLPPLACEALIASAEADARWHPGTYIDETTSSDVAGDAALRRCLVRAEADDPRLFHLARKTIEDGFRHILSATTGSPMILVELQLIKYGPGDFFIAHQDATRTAFRWRRYSIVCYLNKDFEGGATTFPRLRVSIRGEVGQAILFPSHYSHGGERVAQGTKYILTGYLGDPRMMPH